MAHNSTVFVGSNGGVKNSLSGGTGIVLPLMRLSLKRAGPAETQSQQEPCPLIWANALFEPMHYLNL